MKLSLDALFFFFLGAALVFSVGGIFWLEFVRRRYINATDPSAFAVSMRELVYTMDPADLHITADAVRDRAKALLDANMFPLWFNTLANIYAGLRTLPKAPVWIPDIGLSGAWSVSVDKQKHTKTTKS